MTLIEEHRGRITKVLNHIHNNISQDLNVEDLGKIACYSKFHFNRIFKSVTGESVYRHIKRVRLEKSVDYLWNTDLTISEIATKCGFNTISSFSYNYKSHFNITPQNQRRLNLKYKEHRSCVNICVEHKKLPPMSLAYIKSIGNFDDDVDIVNKLQKWADCRQYLGEDGKFIRLSYDSTHVTSKEHFRTDLCVLVRENTLGSESISVKNFPETDVISRKVKLLEDVHQIMSKIDDMFYWILTSGFEAVPNRPVILFYENGWFPIKSSGDVPVEIEICIPVILK